MAGRPTDYSSELCDKVIEYGESGKSLTWMAAEIGVSRDTMYEWMSVHSEFSDAMTRARALSQKWWEDAGQSGLTMPGFNASIWSRSMSARFPEEWRENKGVELTGANGGPIQTAGRIELVPLGNSTDQASS